MPHSSLDEHKPSVRTCAALPARRGSVVWNSLARRINSLGEVARKGLGTATYGTARSESIGK